MEDVKADAETMNALVNGLAAVVFALVRRLPAAEQRAFSNDLAAMAKQAERRGAQVEETLLLDLYRASKIAP